MKIASSHRQVSAIVPQRNSANTPAAPTKAPEAIFTTSAAAPELVEEELEPVFEPLADPVPVVPLAVLVVSVDCVVGVGVTTLVELPLTLTVRVLLPAMTVLRP